MKKHIIGWDDSIGVYKLIDNTNATPSKEKFELVRGEENVLRFSLISRHLRWLQGEILTILEASMDDGRKLTATKELVKDTISRKINWLYEQCGMSEEEQDYLSENRQNPDPTKPE